jgi:hypothetical protein
MVMNHEGGGGRKSWSDLSWNLPVVTEETTTNFSEEIRSSDQDSNQRPLEYEAEVLTTLHW